MDVPTLPTVILGGGFTGLFTALHLCNKSYPERIILIDQAERFVFKPLLYELLSGEMTTNQVWPRFAELLNCDAITFVQDSVSAIDLSKKEIKLATGLCYAYGKLVLCLGSTSNYFGIQGAKEHTFSLRDGSDAIALSQHLRTQLQQASQTKDPQLRRALLTVAIVGAGPAGIEMAATLGDLLPQWYRKLGGNIDEIQIVVLNRAEKILKGDLNGTLRETTLNALDNRLVRPQILSKAAVQEIFQDKVEYKQADAVHELPAATIVWAAGNDVHPLVKSLTVEERDRAGRLKALPTLQLPSFQDVFVGGDVSILDSPLPPTAQVAYQQGAGIAANLMALAQGQSLKPVKVSLRGTLMKLGLREGAAYLFDKVLIPGRAGHLMRQGTYVRLLPNPVHNFKATVEWITEEVFQAHSPSVRPKPVPHGPFKWVGDGILITTVAATFLLVWRTVGPATFTKALEPTGIPTLLDYLQYGPDSEDQQD
ncbi:MAG: NAD(P)/FAD-dependent oxidoreductase [Cyanobacteria bacterium P01_F01_bin.150]